MADMDLLQDQLTSPAPHHHTHDQLTSHDRAFAGPLIRPEHLRGVFGPGEWRRAHRAADVGLSAQQPLPTSDLYDEQIDRLVPCPPPPAHFSWRDLRQKPSNMPSRATGTDKKAQVEHVDHPIPTASPNADVEGGKTLPAAFGAIDEETAKYLNPDIVIDEETNQRIKSMVRSVRSENEARLAADPHSSTAGFCRSSLSLTSSRPVRCLCDHGLSR